MTDITESNEYSTESSATCSIGGSDSSGIIHPLEPEEPDRKFGKEKKSRLHIYVTFFSFLLTFLLLILVIIVVVLVIEELQPTRKSSTIKILKIPVVQQGDNDVNNINYNLESLTTNEYLCTGSCHCEIEEQLEQERRRNLALSSSTYRSSFYITAAVTSFIAFHKAKRHFDQDCEDEFINVCSSIAEVEECLPTMEENIAAEQNLAKFKNRYETLYIDVRTKEEFEIRSLSVAININYEDLRLYHPDLPDDYDTPITVFCRTGRRSGIAKTILEAFGYTDVFNAGSVDDMKFLYGED